MILKETIIHTLHLNFIGLLHDIHHLQEGIQMFSKKAVTLKWHPTRTILTIQIGHRLNG